MSLAIGDPRRGRAVIRDSGRVALFYGGTALLGLLAGALSSSGRLVLIAIFVGLLAAAALSLSRHALLWFVIVGALLVTGAAQLYLPELRYFKYVLPIVAGLLLVHGVMDRLMHPADRHGGRLPAIVLWSCAFIAIAGLSMIANRDTGMAIMGVRDYFVMWILFFALILIRWRPGELDVIPWAMLAIALVQLPFSVHQYLVLVPMREGLGDGIVAVDIIAGTFGASLWGGGSNAVLSLFMFLVVSVLLGLWKSGAIRGRVALPLSLLLMLPIFFNEAKIAAVYFPVMLLVLFYRDIIDHPRRFLAMSVAGFGVFAALMTAFTAFHPSGELRTWSDLVQVTFSEQTSEPEERRGQWSELTRWTAVTFWAEEQASAHPAHLLIGHGPSAARVPEYEGGVTLASTMAETRYGGLRIGYTAVSALLWDVGILGFASVMGIFAAAYLTAARLALACRGRSPGYAGVFDGLRAGIVLLVISLVHKDFFVFHLPYQTLVLLILGYLVVSSRSLGADGTGRSGCT